MRAVKVPFETAGGMLKLAGISALIVLEVPAGSYSLQVEYTQETISNSNKENMRFNKKESGFSILSADDEIQVHSVWIYWLSQRRKFYY